MPSETASPPSTAAILAEIVLPKPVRLSPPQVRGAACVWCAAGLHGDDATDLGQRYDSILGVVGRWFPRGCRECTEVAVTNSGKQHAGSCEQCTDDPALCEKRSAIQAVTAELRR
jgi:hypothetical protein